MHFSDYKLQPSFRQLFNFYCKFCRNVRWYLVSKNICIIFYNKYWEYILYGNTFFLVMYWSLKCQVSGFVRQRRHKMEFDIYLDNIGFIYCVNFGDPSAFPHSKAVVIFMIHFLWKFQNYYVLRNLCTCVLEI